MAFTQHPYQNWTPGGTTITYWYPGNCLGHLLWVSLLEDNLGLFYQQQQQQQQQQHGNRPDTKITLMRMNHGPHRY